MMRVENEQGFILHTRNFTDSKIILCVFTRSYGRLNLVYRSTKKTPKPKNFILCSLNWFGKNDLKTLQDFEEIDTPILGMGKPLFCGMYLNEICMRLLPELQSFEKIYDCYIETIQKLARSDHDAAVMEVLLRRFEFNLLSALGLAINFHKCVDGEQILDSVDGRYVYLAERGFKKINPQAVDAYQVAQDGLFQGADLVAIREQRWSASALNSAKKISRISLAPLLGNKPIKSRELFT